MTPFKEILLDFTKINTEIRGKGRALLNIKEEYGNVPYILKLYNNFLSLGKIERKDLR